MVEINEYLHKKMFIITSTEIRNKNSNYKYLLLVNFLPKI
jgi:hypothetical protein